MDILNFLNGKKTYIGVIAGAIYSVLISLGYVPNNELVWTGIATWTGFSFRSAIAKAE